MHSVKQQKTLEKLLDLKSSESSTNQPLRHSPTAWKSARIRVSPSLISAAGHSTFPFSMSAMASLKFLHPMETDISVAMISINASLILSARNSARRKASTFAKIQWLFNDSRKPLKKPRSNCRLKWKLRSICRLSLRIRTDQSTCKSLSRVPSLKNFARIYSNVFVDHA